jgi:outer membrane protein OmpA-like peptidoglycan-associated protein
MSRLGKCNNFSGCLLAYRGEETSVPDGQPFICAECGKPLSEVKAPAGRWIIYAVGGLAVVALIGGAAVTLPKMLAKKRVTKEATTPAPSSTPSTSTTTTTTEPPRTTDTPPPANPDKKGDAEPPATVVAAPKIDLNVDPQVKAEVLKRIDLMPTLSPTEKDKLYNSVERARKMGLVITVPFGKGKTALSPGDALALKDALEKPDIATLRNDPLAVLVILGYADPKGDAKANLQFSKDRADAVASVIKKDFGDRNLVRSVAMGGSTLLDAQSMEKNRIAEVWVVLP